MGRSGRDDTTDSLCASASGWRVNIGRTNGHCSWVAGGPGSNSQWAASVPGAAGRIDSLAESADVLPARQAAKFLKGNHRGSSVRGVRYIAS